jgi:hypothetical protein
MVAFGLTLELKYLNQPMGAQVPLQIVSALVSPHAMIIKNAVI